MESILGGALQKKTGEWTRQDKTRIAAIMRRRGLEYKRERMYRGGEPVLDPNGEQCREYHFRWPIVKTPKK